MSVFTAKRHLSRDFHQTDLLSIQNRLASRIWHFDGFLESLAVINSSIKQSPQEKNIYVGNKLRETNPNYRKKCWN